MSTATTSRTENPFMLDPGMYNDAVTRAQDLNARVLQGMKNTGLTSLDAYDKAVQTLTDLQVRMADASQLDWLAAQTRTQAEFVREMNAALTKAARIALS